MGEPPACFSVILSLWATAHHLKGLKMDNKYGSPMVKDGAIGLKENVFCCGACGQIVSHSEGEQITNNGFAEFVHRADKCDANDEIKEIEIKSMFIECREWFDKVNGNSYFSARIWVNGGQVAILPFQYGYGDQFIYEAQKKLLELGYLSQEGKSRGMWSIAKALGYDYYTAKAYTNKKEMFKLYENYQEETVTISNKETN